MGDDLPMTGFGFSAQTHPVRFTAQKRTRDSVLRWLTAFFLAQVAAPAGAQNPPAPEVEVFIGEMVQKHQFEAGALTRLFARVQPVRSILRSVSSPSTARPWHEFRSRNVDPQRIKAGGAYWQLHAATLARARREYGVPEEIIVATLGIETLYGRNTGRYRVFEALTTLAFHYPPRADLFRAELEAYLLMAREGGVDPMAVRGSYAGAMGIPQFLPSSYRRFAVDFDGDGKSDLMVAADAIGSVANYYRAHGWQAGAAVIVPAEVAGDGAEALMAMGIKPQLKVSELKQRGVVPAQPVNEGAEAALFSAETETGPRYWLGLNNFYVITRYNRSINYALAVYELARELRAGRPVD
jgi:membrane-bound lytic murein transglycosylase B